jgi:hypothetical protein
VLIGSVRSPVIQAYLTPQLASTLRRGATATVRFPDGTRMLAVVHDAPSLTKRLPSDMIEQSGARPLTVLLDLRGEGAWPMEQRIHGLPVRLRFHYSWEQGLAGRLIGGALAWLSGYG